MAKRRVSLAIILALSAGFFTTCSNTVEVSNAERASGERAADLSKSSKAVASGKLEGRGGHRMSGSVSLRESDGKYILEFGDDFDFDGAPAPVVAFGKKGYRKETQIGKLRQNEGKHSYEVPEKIAAEGPGEVWVWCTDYDVPLGTATLVKK